VRGSTYREAPYSHSASSIPSGTFASSSFLCNWSIALSETLIWKGRTEAMLKESFKRERVN
jgi:hypothetical protein